jgi:eukaryotic-like serine/threonine-protein kinase
MPHVVRCPTMAELQEFLLGKSGACDVETVEQHLTACPDCQQRLERINAEDELVCALRVGTQLDAHCEASSDFDKRSPLATTASSAGSLVEKLLPLLKRIPEGLDRTVTGIAAEATPREAALETETAIHGSDPTSTGTVPGKHASQRLGRYELAEVLGRGGMGTVYRAWDPLLERQVAIKVPRTEVLANRKVRERLLQEARAAAAVVDDHIVPIHAVEESGGTTYLVMPLLSGMTLKQYAERIVGPIPVDELLRIAREAATGLAAAHRRGLLHCDIKPANLWMEAPANRVKLLDFGLAVPYEMDGPEPVGGSGTPGYLAPEQVQGRPIDPRTDVFGLGCVLYQLATGRLPYIGADNMRIYWTVMAALPPALLDRRPDVPSRLGDLVERMLDRDPEKRPADGGAVLDALLAIDAERQAMVVGRQRRRVWLSIAMAAVLGGGGIGLWAAWFGPRVPEDVLMRTTVTDANTGVILVRDGVEQRIPPGQPTTIALAPGQYEVRPDGGRSTWSVYPQQLVIEAEQSNRTVLFELCGELQHRTAHAMSGTGVLIQSGADGTSVFSVGQDRRLVRWAVDAGSGTPLSGIDLPHEARCLAMSADGTQVYTAGGNRQSGTGLETCRWEVRGLTPSGQLEAGERLVQTLACSADGRWVAAAGADGIRLWDSGRLIDPRLELEAVSGVHSIRWHPLENRLAAVGEEGRFATWSSREDRFELSRHGTCGDAALRSVVWWGDDLVAAGDDGQVWRIGGEQAAERLLETGVSTRAAGVLALGLADNGAWLLTAERSGTVSVFSTADWRKHGALVGHRGEVTAVDIERGSRRAVTTGRDGTVRVWQLPAVSASAKPWR